jgi:hypothetical protein
VLRVISSAPGELEPVFQAILANATRICNAKFGNLWLCEGNNFCIAATHGAPPAYVALIRQSSNTGSRAGAARYALPRAIERLRSGLREALLGERE